MLSGFKAGDAVGVFVSFARDDFLRVVIPL
jgi:hypothetical protein